MDIVSVADRYISAFISHRYGTSLWKCRNSDVAERILLDRLSYQFALTKFSTDRFHIYINRNLLSFSILFCASLE